MGRPCHGLSNNVWHLYVSLKLLEIDLLTLSLGVGLKLPPFINSVCGQIGRPCPDIYKKGMTLVCKSVGLWDGIVNPIFGCGVEITPDINPICWVGKVLS